MSNASSATKNNLCLSCVLVLIAAGFARLVEPALVPDRLFQHRASKRLTDAARRGGAAAGGRAMSIDNTITNHMYSMGFI